jgi:hypothetical protein
VNSKFENTNSFLAGLSMSTLAVAGGILSAEAITGQYGPKAPDNRVNAVTRSAKPVKVITISTDKVERQRVTRRLHPTPMPKISQVAIPTLTPPQATFSNETSATQAANTELNISNATQVSKRQFEDEHSQHDD